LVVEEEVVEEEAEEGDLEVVGEKDLKERRIEIEELKESVQSARLQEGMQGAVFQEEMSRVK